MNNSRSHLLGGPQQVVDAIALQTPQAKSWKVVDLAIASVVAIYYMLQAFMSRPNGIKAPVVGFRSWLEPSYFLRLRFTFGASALIQEGYNKYKNSMFKLYRSDADILIVSNKYLDELNSLPDEELSAALANDQTMFGEYTKLNTALKNNLEAWTVASKLTPNIGNLIGTMKEELDFAMSVEMPQSDDWKTIDFSQIIRRIVGRVSSRVFLSRPTCRDEAWLQLSRKFTEDVFMSIMLLRAMPSFLCPLLARVLPSVWACRRKFKSVQSIVGPVVQKRRKLQAMEEDAYQKPNDFLQWMMDAADKNEGKPERLADHQLSVALGAINPVGMTIANCMYELCARPQYLQPLREEVVRVLQEDGGWKQTTLSKMRKLDSFAKETLRLNPPSLLSFHRTAQTAITLSDGAVIPAGTQLYVASGPIAQDAQVDASADVFDGFRYFKMREDPLQANKHQLDSIDLNFLHFGYGKHACPGRFFASNEIKLIMAHLLLEYEFKYPKGKGCPKYVTADEMNAASPLARLSVRKRRLDTEKAGIKYYED